MSENIAVPEGMLKAAIIAYENRDAGQDWREIVCKAAIGWLSENPIVPSEEQAKEILKAYALRPEEPISANDIVTTRILIREWQRCMFRKPEPEVPEELKALLYRDFDNISTTGECMNEKLHEAYRLGQQSGEPKPTKSSKKPCPRCGCVGIHGYMGRKQGKRTCRQSKESK